MHNCLRADHSVSLGYATRMRPGLCVRAGQRGAACPGPCASRSASGPPQRARTLVRHAALCALGQRGRMGGCCCRTRRAGGGRAQLLSNLKFSAVLGTRSSNSSNTMRSTLPPPAAMCSASARSAPGRSPGRARRVCAVHYRTLSRVHRARQRHRSAGTYARARAARAQEITVGDVEEALGAHVLDHLLLEVRLGHGARPDGRAVVPRGGPRREGCEGAAGADDLAACGSSPSHGRFAGRDQRPPWRNEGSSR